MAAVIEYLLARGSRESPLFTWQDGWYLTRDYFVHAVKEALMSAGLKPRIMPSIVFG